ncbi:MAG TPA: entericidin A/B family lipoprotein [Methylophilus sp.]|nr:entericidin A/B family lipoprotein [Methylophilus sp.]
MKMLRLMTMIVCVWALTACNTIDGMGKDLEKAGEAVQKSTK